MPDCQLFMNISVLALFPSARKFFQKEAQNEGALFRKPGNSSCKLIDKSILIKTKDSLQKMVGLSSFFCTFAAEFEFKQLF